MKRARFVAIGVVVSALSVWVSAQSVNIGRNNNLNPGIADDLVGDPFLQRQVEFKGACSALNPQHCLFGANDYRTVNFASDTGTAEGTQLFTMLARRLGLTAAKERVAMAPDAWIGLYRCYNGPDKFCANGLLPGFPTDATPLGLSQPWSGMAAGSDVSIAADPNGYFPSAALLFNRGGRSMVVTWALRDYNDDSRQPIRWARDSSGQPLIGTVLDVGSATANGQFNDLPSIVADVYRGPAVQGSALPCGEWHAAWTTFSNQNSGIWWSVSTDCGKTWSGKRKISNPLNSVQRVILDVDKRPTAQGGGTLYAIFRTFSPDGIAFLKKPYGSDAWSAPVMLTDMSAPAGLCVYDQKTVDTTIGDPTRETARALSFGSLTTTPDGTLVVAFTERAGANGESLRGASCPAVVPSPGIGFASPARPLIHVTYSADGGATWSARKPIDFAQRCEAMTPNNPDGPIELPCNAPNVNSRAAGPQLQPVVRAAPHLFLSYREGRGGLGPDGFHSGRNSEVDVRVARLGFDANGIKLLATNQVSQYSVSAATGDIKDIDGAPGFKAYSRTYLPQYKGGTAGFMGDHEDLIAAEPFVFDASGARWATTADVPSATDYPVWGGDNRDSGFPTGGLYDTFGWTQYSPPGTGAASCTNPTIRNSNGYTAYVGDPLQAYAPQPFKQLGGVFGGGDWSNPQTKKRTWAVVIKNRSSVTRTFVASLQVTDARFNASWDEFLDVKVLGNTANNPTCTSPAVDYPTCTSNRVLLPQSSMTLTVFGTGPGDPVAAPIKVLLNDLDPAMPANPDVVVRLNPNPFNPPPAVFAASGSELHGASVQGPFAQPTKAAPWKNPGPGNPGPGNPGPGNPGPGNPGPGNNTVLNPGPGNPGPGNVGFTDYTDVQYFVTTENLTNTVSAYSTFVNIGNPDAVHANHLIQMIIGETLTTPTAAGCTPIENNVDQIVSTIPVPGPGNPGPGNPGPGNPGPGNPGPGNPGPGNPGPGNPGPGNNTFALAPSSAPQATSLAAASFRATAIARLGGAVFVPIAADLADDGTNVATPPPDQKQITIRYWHCTAALGCQLPDGTIIPGENVTPGGPSDPVNDGTVGNPNQTSGTVVAQANNTNIVNDFYSVNENSGPNNLASVLANDTPGHGGTLSAVVFGNGAGFGPFHGTVVMNPDGSFVYTPAALFYGTDSFNYLATETAGTASSPSSALAKVTITVNHVNQPPVANPDVAVVGDGSGPAAISVLANDTDPEGDQLTVTAVTQPSLAHGGSASSTGTGVTYTPSPNYAGPDSFTYTVCDNGTSTLIGPDPKCAIGTVNVTVVDNIPPVIAAHADVNAAATNASGAVVNYARPATSDNVDPAGLAVCAPAPNSQFPLGNTNVTCNATDAAGNPAVATNFVVHVVDTTPPVVTVPAPLILEATGPGGAVGTFNATATDNVDGSDPVTCVPPSGSTFPLGTTNVSCTAKDNAGNTSAPAGFGVTVRDTTRPTLFLPGNIATVATSVSGAIVNFNASATDLVDVSDPVICAPASGSMFTVGTTVVNCSATDAHANRATGSFSVTVTLTFGFVNVQNLPPGAGKTFHPGSAVPLAWAWTLNGVTVDTPDATSRPSIRITGPNGYNTTFPDDPGSSGFQYNTSFVHQYNWQTKNLPVGTYNVFVTSRENGQTSGPFVVILQ